MLFVIPSASVGCINAMLHQTFVFLGQLWQLFEVSQILEFLRYSIICTVMNIHTHQEMPSEITYYAKKYYDHVPL